MQYSLAYALSNAVLFFDSKYSDLAVAAVTVILLAGVHEGLKKQYRR